MSLSYQELLSYLKDNNNQAEREQRRQQDNRDLREYYKARFERSFMERELRVLKQMQDEGDP